MSEREQVPRPFLVPAALVFAAGLATFGVTFWIVPPRAGSELALLVIAAVLSENYAVALRGFTVSLAFPLAMAAAQLHGPSAAALVAAMTFTNIAELRARRPAAILAFNLGQVLLWGVAAGWTYVGFGGPLLGVQGAAAAVPFHAVVKAGLALVAASVVGTTVNVLFAGLGVSILRGVRYQSVIKGVLEYVPTQLALAFVGFLMAIVLSIEPVAFPLFLFPLFLARQVYQRFASLRDAYLDMVRSLVGALEAKDPYTRGHSERVAEYASKLARHIGTDERTIELVEQAALLHDIGKLSLPISVLTKPSGLTDDEFASVRRHPWVGGEMVRVIPALRGLSDPIKAHHERIDGSGYPIGMRDDEIPLVARMLAVADAYDAMTTHRAYRPAMSHGEAIDELLMGAGSQFDENLVRAFINGGIGRPEERLGAGPCALGRAAS